MEYTTQNTNENKVTPDLINDFMLMAAITTQKDTSLKSENYDLDYKNGSLTQYINPESLKFPNNPKLETLFEYFSNDMYPFADNMFYALSADDGVQNLNNETILSIIEDAIKYTISEGVFADDSINIPNDDIYYSALELIQNDFNKIKVGDQIGDFIVEQSTIDKMKEYFKPIKQDFEDLDISDFKDCHLFNEKDFQMDYSSLQVLNLLLSDEQNNVDLVLTHTKLNTKNENNGYSAEKSENDDIITVSMSLKDQITALICNYFVSSSYDPQKYGYPNASNEKIHEIKSAVAKTMITLANENDYLEIPLVNVSEIYNENHINHSNNQPQLNAQITYSENDKLANELSYYLVETAQQEQTNNKKMKI